MADPALSRLVSTEGLIPGDHVTGSERWELMLPAAGLYVVKVEYDSDRKSETCGCSLVWWKDGTRPEAFNPYYGWYVDNRDINGNHVELQGENNG